MFFLDVFYLLSSLTLNTDKIGTFDYLYKKRNKNNRAMYYLHFYETQEEHDAAYLPGGIYDEPWVGVAMDTGNVSYDRGIEPREIPLTFRALESGTFKFSGNTVS